MVVGKRLVVGDIEPGLSEIDIEAFRRRFLSDKDAANVAKPEPNSG
jgi:hypothetical protein